MKKIILLLTVILLGSFSKAQQPSKAELEKLMNESLKNLDPATRKKMMESGGMRPNTNSDKPIIPVKDIKRISSLPKNILSDAMLAVYLKSTVTTVSGKISAEAKELAKKVIETIQSTYKDNEHWAMAASGLWIAGENEAALVLMGKAATESPSNPDILNGYASFLIQNGGGHLALPILQNLNRRYPGNSTILNNIGQAWFELGDLNTSNRYIDSTIKYFANHSQANFTKAIIQETKGEKQAAAESVKKSIQQAYSPAKVSLLKRVGGSLSPGDINFGKLNSESGYSLGKFITTNLDFYYGDRERETLLPKWADYIRGMTEKKSAIENKDPGTSGQTDMNRLLQGANLRPGFLSRKANDRLSALYEKYIDFQSRHLKESYEMDMAFNQRTSKIPVLMGQEVDKCTGVGDYKAWAYEYNQRLQQFRAKTLTQSRQLIEDIVFMLRYASMSEEVFQMQKQQLETDFIGYCVGVGTTPFDFQPGVLNADILITECSDSKISDQQFIRGPLPDFDIINCTTHGSIPLGFGKYTWDCNIENVEIDASLGPIGGKLKYTENWVKGTFNGNGELVISKTIGSRELGPVSVEAVVGAGGFIEFTDRGISDIGAIGKAGVEVNGPVPGVGGEVIGIEGRMGWNSGPSISGTGILSGK